MKYYYEVIESESKKFKIGQKLVLYQKMHDDRTKGKIGRFSDVDCNDIVLKLVKTQNE